jgi:hypothetical protein
MGEAGDAPDSGGAVKEAIDRLLPVLTTGMTAEEAGKARETLWALFTLRAARPGPDTLERETAERMKRAGSLSLEGRRRMLREDELALAVEKLGGQISETAVRVLQGEVRVTRVMKRETRRTLARLGQLNAVLAGRFPHLTPLLEEVSDAYLDAMFILGDGKGPMSNRLQQVKKARESPRKGG